MSEVKMFELRKQIRQLQDENRNLKIKLKVLQVELAHAQAAESKLNFKEQTQEG